MARRPSIFYRAIPNGRQTAVAGLILINSAIELWLQALDMGYLQGSFDRATAYRMGAFYAPILRDWVPYYPLQPYVMFVSYAFLHGGWLHLLLNMLALTSFGNAIAEQVGTGKFLLAYFLSAIGGAALYGILSNAPTPMVGASGALFGLLGVWICWGYLERRHYGESLRSVYRALIILAVYNLAFFLLLHGRLAWETHLGGFLAGWLVALYWGRPIYRRKRRSS